MAAQVVLLLWVVPPATLIAIGTVLCPEVFEKLTFPKFIRGFLFWPFHLAAAASIISEYGDSAVYNPDAVHREWMDNKFGKEGILRTIAEVVL